MKMATRLGALACAASLATAAAAQDGTPVDPADVDVVTRMNAAVNTVALERMGDLVEPGDMLRLLVVAQQQALTESCEGYEMDWERYSAVMADIMADLFAMTEEGQNNLPVDVVLMAYSMSLGGQLAVAAYDPEAYCARGEVIRAELAEDTEGRLTVLASLD